MKKILIFILTIFMLLSFGMLGACNSTEGGSSFLDKLASLNPFGDKKAKESIFIINGFNEYDDIAYTYLNPNTFYGTFTRNKDKQYIVEGEASYKFRVDKVGVTQPNFEMKADRVKTDITDVVEFGIYIHSNAEYEFEVILKCQDTTYGIIYKGTAKVKKGANNIVLPVDRAILQDTGTAVRYYDISFNGLKGDTVLYLDNFYAKVTTEEVKVKDEVQEVITGITNLTASDRVSAEAIYAKYKKLSSDDRRAVYNYKILRSIMAQFWNADIAEAQKTDSETLLFFDKPFGEGQIKSVSEAVQYYGYTEEMRYGDEDGSMKLTFQSATATWNSITTTIAGASLPEDAMIEFYIYNNSDQKKGFEVDWTYPTTGYLILAPHEWTRVYCEASHLTARGYMVFVGLSKESSAQVPEGSMYFSAIRIFSLENQINSVREQNNQNTVFVFDNELGVKQVSPKYNISDGNISYDTTVKPEGSNGSLKVSANLDNSTNKQIELYYDIAGYNFNEGDLVYMEVYADLQGADFAEIRWGTETSYRTRITNKQWGIVVVEASQLVNTEDKCFRLYSCVYTSSSYDGIDFKGSIYFGKAKAVVADDVVTTSEEGIEYTFGSQGIEYVGGKGRGTFGWIGNWAAGNSNAYNQVGDTQPQIIDGNLRFYMQGGVNRVAMTMCLKNAFTVTANSTFKVTVRGAKKNNNVQFGIIGGTGASGEFIHTTAESIEELDNGYTVYTFKFSSSWVGKTFDEISFWPNGNNNYAKPYFEQVNIVDIVYENVTWAE